MDTSGPSAHYISGTHWDREWYRPFQEFRFLLVRLLDGLIDLMESDADFRHFHLDGQTCMLEDYCAIRPERRERLAALIRSGRILIGPWYTMPDLFCVGDEALLRNLAHGRAVAKAWGVAPMPVGFVCDMFGHPSQMPQIFAGFGCHDIVLGRGVNETDTPAIFAWKAPDGSTAVTFKLQDAQGYGAMALPRACLETPTFVLASLPGFTAELAAAGDDPQAAADTRARWAERTLGDYLSHERDRANGGPLCLFDSMDHAMPVADVAAWLARLARIAPGIAVRHSTLPEFFAEVRQVGATWPVRQGELRAPSQHRHGYNWLIPNCVSARIRLKQANDRCQNLLERWAEPLVAFANRDGAGIAPRFLTTAWQTLLGNQAHDSIGGCSIDQVHRDMVARFDEVTVLAETLRNQTVGDLTREVQELSHMPGGSTLILINPLPWERDSVCDFDVDLPLDHAAEFRESFFSPAIKGFILETPEGRVIPYQRLSYAPRTNERSRYPRFSFQSDGPFTRYRIAARIVLPACGFTALRIRPAAIPDPSLGCLPVRHRGSMLTGPRAAGNGRLSVAIAADGTVSLHDLRTDEVYRDLLQFEHQGETGDGWFHVQPMNGATSWSTGSPCTTAVLHDGPELITFRICLAMSVPTRHDPAGDAPADTLTTLRISSLITLRAGADHLEITTTLDHQAEDFRLRVLLPTDIPDASTWLAHHPFDFVERPIALDPATAGWQEAELAEKPFLHLQSVGHGRRGLAFLSGGGLHEGGVADDHRRTQHITLLRSFRSTIATGGERDGLETGRLSWRYALLPFAGTLPCQRALAVVAELQTGLATRQSGARPSGYLPLPPTGITSRSLLAQLDHRLIISAIMPATEGEGLVVRLWNPSGQIQSERLRLDRPCLQARLVSLSETPLPNGEIPRIAGNLITVSAPPHGIITLLLSGWMPSDAAR